MKRNVLALLTLIILTGSMLTLFGCNRGSSSTGKYFDEINPNNYTELKSDGTFVVHKERSIITGKYSVDGDRLSFTLSSGEIFKGKIEGNTIIGDTGGRSTKQQ